MKLSAVTQIALLTVIGGRALCGSAVVSALPAVQNTTVGQTISLNIGITGVSDLYAWQFDLGFDPTKLAAVSIAEGGFLQTGGATVFVAGKIDNTFGTISSTADTLSAAVPGVSNTGSTPETLATATFQVIGAGPSTVNIFNPFLLDSTLASISATTTGATVNGATSGVPEPSTFPLLLVLATSATGVAIYRRKNLAR